MKLLGLYISRTDWKTKYAESELKVQAQQQELRDAYSKLWFWQRQHYYTHKIQQQLTDHACACLGFFDVVKLYLQGVPADKEKLIRHIEEIGSRMNLAHWTLDEMKSCLDMYQVWDKRALDKINEILK